jgi:hypothetical protein
MYRDCNRFVYSRLDTEDALYNLSLNGTQPRKALRKREGF